MLRCNSSSAMVIAILRGGGGAIRNVFALIYTLHIAIVHIRTVGCADTFRCGVCGAVPDRRMLLGTIRKGRTRSDGYHNISLAWTARYVICVPVAVLKVVMPHFTLSFVISCVVQWHALSVSTRAVIKFYFPGPDGLSPKTIYIHLIEGF